MLFYYVALTGSVTKASEKLHISQPAISAQIRKFEKENNIMQIATCYVIRYNAFSGNKDGELAWRIRWKRNIRNMPYLKN
ncbi:MAG TPA: hypothetical protein DEA91_09820 [Paenibacillus sp.]|nr:hypothetical protein [Paenibacillus sp.]